MALPTNQKNQIELWLPGFGSGKYFILYAFVFLFSISILSVSLEYVVVWSLNIAGILVIIGIFIKNPIVCLAGILPIIAGVLLNIEVLNSEGRQKEANEFLAQNSSISAVIVDLGNSRKGRQRATLELSNEARVYSYIPAHSSNLLGRKIELDQPIFSSGSLMQFSRGIIGEVKYSGFALGEIQPEYRLLLGKSHIIERIQKVFPPPESALLNGILVGDDSLMDEDFTTLYRTIGLSHITVVSGSNIAAVLAILYILLQRFGQGIRVGLSLLGVGMYVLMVGTDPPVLRALLMGSISLIALTYGDRVDALRILLFTALILTIASPLSLVYDAGFQLSFLATLGILVSVRLLKKHHIGIQALGVSIFAGIWTLPISIGTFGSIHLWSIPANILAGPAVQISMMLGGLAILLDTLYEPIGYLIGYIPYFSLLWIQKVAESLSQLPGQIAFNSEIQPIIGFLIFGITIGLSLRYLHLPNPTVESSALSDR